MVIDSHHHFWNYDAEEYGWISESMSLLRRDFGPEHLRREIAAANVDAVVSVQARQTIEETDWLLDLATKHQFIRGVVGWVPLIDPNVRSHLDRLSNPKLKALRHVIQDEPDENY